MQLSLKDLKSQTNLTSPGLHDYLPKPTYLNLVISKNINHGTCGQQIITNIVINNHCNFMLMWHMIYKLSTNESIFIDHILHQRIMMKSQMTSSFVTRCYMRRV